jgi:hypothetical protein
VDSDKALWPGLCLFPDCGMWGRGKGACYDFFYPSTDNSKNHVVFRVGSRGIKEIVTSPCGRGSNIILNLAYVYNYILLLVQLIGTV